MYQPEGPEGLRLLRKSYFSHNENDPAKGKTTSEQGAKGIVF